MNIRYLTPQELEIVDPTNMGRQFLKSLKSGSPTPVPRIFKHLSREEWLEQWRSRRQSTKLTDSDLIEWLDAAVAKYGAQGARFPLSELRDSYARSYAYASRPVSYKYAVIGRDYFLAVCKDLIDKYGRPQVDYPHYGIVGTSGALPTMQKKGTFYAEAFPGPSPSGFRHRLPVLPGERDQNLKHRCINQDACSNVRDVEDVLSATRMWLKQYTSWFDAWTNPVLSYYPKLYQWLCGPSFSSVETDFSACDEHWSLELAVDLVLPVYELLVPDRFLSFATAVEEMFYQPIFFGSYVLEGKHNLLSGQTITSDFETIYDVMVLLGIILVLELMDQSYFLAIGDDIALLLRGLSDATVAKVYDMLVDEFTRNGMAISKEKSRVYQNSVRFCRRAFHRGCGPVCYNINGQPFRYGVYPDFRTLNTIINPEKPDKRAVDVVISTLQRCDNLYGSPLFTPFVQYIWSNARGEDFVDDLYEAALAHPRDWWDRLYGEIWLPATSPTLKALEKANIKIVK